MAGLIGIARVEGVALSAATLKTVIKIDAPTNQRVKILSVGVNFDGTSGTNEPVTVELTRLTTAGTFTNANQTPVKNDDSIGDAIQTDYEDTVTAEPTKGDVIDSWLVHPQGAWREYYPFGQEPIIGAGDSVGVVITAPDAVNCDVVVKFEE